MECIEKGKICAMSNLKCKECRLLDCKETAKILEEEEEMKEKQKKAMFDKLLKRVYPYCYKCPFLEILDRDKQKVRCPYMVKERCILK